MSDWEKMKAKSEGKVPRYNLLPPRALAEVIESFEAGSARYDESPTERNWWGGVGDIIFKINRVCHAIHHLFAWLRGDTSEPHLSHAAANCLMIRELEFMEEDKKEIFS